MICSYRSRLYKRTQQLINSYILMKDKIVLIAKYFFGGMSMGLNKEKMKEVIHYIISMCGTQTNLWRTNLYKILYFSDFDYFELNNKSMTNEEYSRYPRGPVPVHFINLKNELVEENKISETEEYPFEGADNMGFSYKSLKSSSFELLSDDEKRVIDAVINRVKHMNTDQISDYSHGDMPWIVAEDQEILEYRYVFYRNNDYSVREYNESGN